MLCAHPALTPGSAYLYSNAGYIVVGAALEQATGQPWEELMSERLFAPLAMTDCGFGPPASPDAVDNPWGHTVTGGVILPIDPGELVADNPAAFGPAGTVHCSMESWARFAAAHLAGAQGDESFLSAASWSSMHTPAPGDDYAFGWGVVDDGWAAEPVLQHAGNNTMFFAFAIIAPSEDLALLMAMNIGDDRALSAVRDLRQALIDGYSER